MGLAIYSALIGSYERPIPQPEAGRLGADMIMFTDQPSAFAGSGWNVVAVEPRFPLDPVRSARYIKTVGHPVLDDYSATMWIDNRVVLKSAARALWRELDQHDIAVPVHSYRACLRAEFEEVIASGYDDPSRVRETFRLARSGGVAMNSAPLWTGIMLRQRTDRVAQAMRYWMDYILMGSRRDQLSIHAALLRANLDLRAIELDNVASPFHEWLQVNAMSRRTAVQRWRPPRRSFAVRLADALRSRETTRRALRVFARIGISVPTLGAEKASAMPVTPADGVSP